MISEILGGVATKIASLGIAAKAGIGVGVAAAAVTTAGVAGVVPVPDLDSSGSRPAIEVELPDVPTPDADQGLQMANDAISGQLPTRDESEAAGKPEVTGIDRARQTPATQHLPSTLPARPDGVPTSNGGASTTGIDQARQTPAADYLPSFVPGAPEGVPAGGSPATSRGATGTDIAKQTPAAGRLPR
jgi:hypothetical protein